MVQAAARRIGAGRIDRSLAFFDVLNLAVLVHHKRGAVGHSIVLHEYTVGLGHLPLGEIAQQRERKVQLLGEFLLRGSVVRADAEYLGVLSFKFGDTRLVRREFLRSTTGEGGREECQDDNLLAAKRRKRDFLPVRGSQRKVRRRVADLETGLRRRSLRAQTGGKARGQERGGKYLHAGSLHLTLAYHRFAAGATAFSKGRCIRARFRL